VLLNTSARVFLFSFSFSNQKKPSWLLRFSRPLCPHIHPGHHLIFVTFSFTILDGCQGNRTQFWAFILTPLDVSLPLLGARLFNSQAGLKKKKKNLLPSRMWGSS